MSFMIYHAFTTCTVHDVLQCYRSFRCRTSKAFERIVRIECDVYNICKFMHAILAEMIVERGKSEVDPIIYQFPKFIPCEPNLI